MRNITLIKLRLRGAFRNLQDYQKIIYLTGVIEDSTKRYILIWEDYNLSKKWLEEIDNEFFSGLDSIQLPELIESQSFYNKSNVNIGYPAQSRSNIQAAIENAFEYISSYEAINFIKTETSEVTIENTDLIKRIFRNWSKMITSLKSHRKDIAQIQVTNEYEMQYLLEGVLRLFFDDVRPETYTPNYANSSNRTDFLLPKQKILIETKMTRVGLDARKLSEELIIDKEHYRKHPSIEIILCLIYDPERRIKNPEGLKDIQELVVPPYFNIYFSY